MEENSNYAFSDEEWNACIKVLTVLKENPLENPDNNVFAGLVVKIYKKAKKDIRNGKLILKNEDEIQIGQNVLNEKGRSSKKENFVLRFLRRIK